MLFFQETPVTAANFLSNPVTAVVILRNTGDFAIFFRRSAVILQKFQPKFRPGNGSKFLDIFGSFFSILAKDFDHCFFKSGFSSESLGYVTLYLGYLLRKNV